MPTLGLYRIVCIYFVNLIRYCDFSLQIYESFLLLVVYMSVWLLAEVRRGRGEGRETRQRRYVNGSSRWILST